MATAQKWGPLSTVSRRLLARIVFAVLSLEVSNTFAAEASSDLRDSEPVLEARFPYLIDFVSFTAKDSNFFSGDSIKVTRVRGDRRHIEPDGRYLIDGDYTLSSLVSADLGLHVRETVHAPLDFGDIRSVTRGSGHFSLKTSMVLMGPFPIFFSTASSKGPKGGVFVSEVSRSKLHERDKSPNGCIVIGLNNDGWIFVDGKRVSGEQLEPCLDQAHRANPGSSVLIKNYDGVGVDQVKFIMDVSHDVGITNVDLQRITLIGIDENGSISFNHVDVSDSELLALLNQIRNIDSEAPVLILINERSPLKRLAFVTGACKNVGLNNVISESR